MSQTITIKCESCDEVREAVRQLNRTMERLVTVLSTLNGKPTSNAKATKQQLAESNGHGRELILVTEFAKRVHRNPKTVHKWIRLRQMPEHSVVTVQGHREIDWNVYEKSIRPVP